MGILVEILRVHKAAHRKLKGWSESLGVAHAKLALTIDFALDVSILIERILAHEFERNRCLQGMVIRDHRACTQVRAHFVMNRCREERQLLLGHDNYRVVESVITGSEIVPSDLRARNVIAKITTKLEPLELRDKVSGHTWSIEHVNGCIQIQEVTTESTVDFQ